MQFFRPLVLLGTLVASATPALSLPFAPIGRRDAQGVYNGISAIDSAVRQLITQLDAYEGGIRQSQPVLDASLAIHAANREAYAVAQSSQGPFSSADSKRIVDHVNDSVGVSIPQSVQILEAKKPLLDTAQLSYVIESTIVTLKTDHETYSAAVGEKLSPDQLAPGLAAAGKIDAVLEGATAYYAASAP